MKLSKLVGERYKETPNGAQLKSHILLLRAGYIKQVSTGIFSMLPPAQRVSQKNSKYHPRRDERHRRSRGLIPCCYAKRTLGDVWALSNYTRGITPL